MGIAMLSRWLVVAALSQAPAEVDWLKVIPADVDLAIRVRGLGAARDDLQAMVRAMSPTWGKMAEDGLAAPFAEISQKHGDLATKTPWVGLIQLSQPGAEGGVSFAILTRSDNYKGALKELSGGKDVELKHQEGDYDAFDSPDGNGTWYAFKGTGIVAFGPGKDLIAKLAKPGTKTLDKVLTGSTA